MTVHKFRSAGVKRVLLLAVAGVLALPADALACWDVCVATFGYVDTMYGSYWELDHCIQTWPDGSNEVHTKCVYRRMYQM